MTTTLTPAQIKEKELIDRYMQFCKEIQSICSKDDKINMTDMCNKHTVKYFAVEAMKNLDIIKTTGSFSMTRYFWTAGNVDLNMAERVHIEVRRIEVNRKMLKRNTTRSLVPLQKKEHFDAQSILIILYDMYKNHKDGSIIDPKTVDGPPAMFDKLELLGSVKKSMAPGMFVWVGEQPTKELSELIFDECCKQVVKPVELQPVKVGKIRNHDSFLTVMKMQAAELEREIAKQTKKLNQLRETIKVFENE